MPRGSECGRTIAGLNIREACRRVPCRHIRHGSHVGTLPAALLADCGTAGAVGCRAPGLRGYRGVPHPRRRESPAVQRDRTPPGAVAEARKPSAEGASTRPEPVEAIVLPALQSV